MIYDAAKLKRAAWTWWSYRRWGQSPQPAQGRANLAVTIWIWLEPVSILPYSRYFEIFQDISSTIDPKLNRMLIPPVIWVPQWIPLPGYRKTHSDAAILLQGRVEPHETTTFCNSFTIHLRLERKYVEFIKSWEKHGKIMGNPLKILSLHCLMILQEGIDQDRMHLCSYSIIFLSGKGWSPDKRKRQQSHNDISQFNLQSKIDCFILCVSKVTLEVTSIPASSSIW